tara:strand:+ start:486 stop:1031 length:546 start_codon:yes stop_codon:yes gene_type:complete
VSLKLQILKAKIHLFSKTGKIGKLHSSFNLSSNGINVKNILICFPADESSFRVAAYSFRKVKETIINETNLIFLVPQNYRELLHFNYGKIFTYQLKTEPDMVFSKEEVRKIVKNMEFDMIIDLNSQFNLSLSQLISLVPSKYKVGFYSEFSDWFYNIQFNISKNSFLEKGYSQIKSLLKTL